MKYCTLCKAKYDDSVSFCPVDGEVLEDDPTSIVDTVLDGQYQMEAMLGKGGMGAVYRARHILLGDRVAIKVLPPEVRNNAEWLRRFRREGQAARRFRHPNAVTVYDLRTASDGTIYMVMEYVEGQTLDAEIKKRGRFTAAESYELLAPIMSVLDTAHSMGVVHRDLKPENIMVGKPDSDGRPVIKLLDLGIAKMREIAGVDTQGNTALTTAGQVLGTPYYMSPEQWGEIPRDGNIEIDGRADIYSLGLVFYEMIAGRRCFAGTTIHELRREHVSSTARPLCEVVPDVPRGFSDAIERATAKDRNDRQPTAGRLAAELRAGLGSASGSRQAAGNFAGPPAPETVAIVLDTNSDLNAPTLVAVDTAASPPVLDKTTAAVGNSAVDVASSPTLAVSRSATGSSPITAFESASGIVLPQPSKPQQVQSPSGRSKTPFIILGLLVAIFVVVAGIVGVFLITRTSSHSNNTSTTSTNTDNPSANGHTNTVANAPRELARYWLELEPRSSKDAATRVAGMVPLKSGQSLKLHFTFNESGFVYIIGPGGNNNQPTAFLTNKPFPASGLKTNAAKQGVDFSFPDGGGRLTLDTQAGTDVFTVIFSKTQLSSPAFFDSTVTGEPLNESERSGLDEFLKKVGQNSSSTELDDTNSQAPVVKVKVAPTQGSNPLVFDIRIQHN